MSDQAQRYRLQLDFTSEAHQRLQEIKKLADTKTNAETIRRALMIYEWYLKQKRDGYALQLAKDGRVKEVELIL